MTIWTRLENVAWRLDRRPAFIVVLLAAIYVALVAPWVHRHLRYDELHTFYIAQARGVGRFFEEIRLLDLNPPLSYLMVRPSLTVLGPTELGARMPAIIGYFLGSMGLFVFIARRVGSLWAAAGVGLFWCNEFFYLAVEARPYSILLAFFGLTLVSWDYAADQTTRFSRKWALAGVGVGASGMLLSHVYAPLWIMPFWGAELVRQARLRRVDWPMWTALVLPMAACLTYIPLVQNATHAVFSEEYQGSAFRALAFYFLIFLRVWPALLTAALAAFAISLWRRHSAAEQADSRTVTTARFQAHELVFLLLSALPPAVLNAVGSRQHIAFYGRYAFLSVLTLDLLILLFIAYESRANRLSGLVAASVILGFLSFAQLKAQPPQVTSNQIAPEEAFARIHPELPLVTNSHLTYLEMDHYEDAALVARLYYLVDPESAIKYTGTNLSEGLLLMKQYFPIRANVFPYADFVATHRHFLVWGEIDQNGWLLSRLKAEKAQVTQIGAFDTSYIDAQLYEVTLNPQMP